MTVTIENAQEATVIRPFTFEATEAELRQAHALFTARSAEQTPGFPLPTFTAYAERWRQPVTIIGRRIGGLV